MDVKRNFYPYRVVGYGEQITLAMELTGYKGKSSEEDEIVQACEYALISLIFSLLTDEKIKIISPGRTRTCNLVVNSHLLHRLSYRGSKRL